MREIHNRENKQCIIYTDSLSSMQSIKFNRQNHPLLNQIYDMLAKLKNQGKHIILWKKVPVHMGMKDNKTADKVANKQKICQE